MFGLFTKPDINQYVNTFKKTDNAVLLDVRTKEEYKQIKIPGSINIELDRIEEFIAKFPDKNISAFVFCRSGSRSAMAAAYLKKMGYKNAVNIGGILDYSGDVEGDSIK